MTYNHAILLARGNGRRIVSESECYDANFGVDPVRDGDNAAVRCVRGDSAVFHGKVLRNNGAAALHRVRMLAPKFQRKGIRRYLGIRRGCRREDTFVCKSQWFLVASIRLVDGQQRKGWGILNTIRWAMILPTS